MDSENAAFWLPSQFLNDEDFLPDIDYVTEKKENDKYDYEFLSELTRHLARSSLNESWNLSTSPQSTLSGLTSNGVSPPLTPPGVKNDAAAWDLLYEAATQVARLKMAAQLHNQTASGFPHHHQNINSFYNNTQQVKRQGSGNAMWGHQQNTQRRTSGGFNSLPHSAWPCTRPGTHQHNLRHRDVRVGPVYLGSGQPVKKQSTGTGVFIPRTFGAYPEPRKNPSATVPGGVVKALNLDHQQINNGFIFSSPRFTPNYDILMARRNTMMNQQRSIRQEMPVTMVGQDVRLPTEWTY